MPYARIDGLELYYEDHGTGPHTVVMAHGALGSVAFAEAFGLSMSALSERGLRVVAYDARGHGRSGCSTVARDYDKRALAEELRLLLDGLELSRVSICGTSMGATSALLFARAHPTRVERLVLRSPAPFGADMIAVRRALGALAWSYQALGTSLTAQLGALPAGPGDRARMRALLQGQRRASIVPALRGVVAEPLDTEHLQGIDAPALILTRPGDFLHPLRSGEILYDRLPNAALCIAPTDTFWDSRPALTADLIAAFVTGRDCFPGEAAVAEGFTCKSRKQRR